MNGIIPDWEWRTFGRNILLNVNLNDFSKVRQIESSEVYIVSTIVEVDPKIQNGKMDIKSLFQVNRDGLEQWISISENTFPIEIEELKDIYKIFKLSMPDFTEETCSYETFIELAQKNHRLIVAEISKAKDLYDVRGCMVERTVVYINGERYITVAVKDPDTELVKKTLIDLGIQDEVNMSYTRAIKLSTVGLLT